MKRTSRKCSVKWVKLLRLDWPRILIHRKTRALLSFVLQLLSRPKKAVAELKNPQVKGKRCGVTRSQDNETLYVRNISRAWSKDDLRNKLKDYGIEDVEELTLMDDPEHEGMNRGFAFLEFNTHLDATNAFKRLQKRDVFFGVDVSAKVAFAKSGIEPDEEIMAQVKSVFVDGLPAAWDEQHVREKFKKYGEIENVQLARNMPSARRKEHLASVSQILYLFLRLTNQSCTDF